MSSVIESAPTPPTAPTSRPPVSRLPPRFVTAAGAAWLAVAVAAAASGIYLKLPPLIPAAIVVVVATTIFVWHRSSTFRIWTQTIDLRLPIYFHVIRVFFGILFLVELGAGNLPATFAERGGYGDILAGIFAVCAGLAVGRAVAGRQPATKLGRTVAWAFSIVGLVDILMVLATAQVGVLIDHDPLLLQAVTRLPYALLPTVVVPLVILTHVLVIQRLRTAARP